MSHNDSAGKLRQPEEVAQQKENALPELGAGSRSHFLCSFASLCGPVTSQETCEVGGHSWLCIEALLRRKATFNVVGENVLEAERTVEVDKSAQRCAVR